MAIASILENRKIKIGLIGLVSILALCLYAATWAQKWQRVEKNIVQYWTLLKENCDKRVQMLPQFAQLIQYYSQEDNLVQTLQKTYEGAIRYSVNEKILHYPLEQEAFSLLQNKVVTVLAQAEKVISRANMNDNRQYLMLKKQLYDTELQIEFADKMLNKYIDHYNRLITIWPESWLNRIYPRAKPLYAPSILTVMSFN